MSALRYEILDLASDDYLGLWEVLWTVKQHFPEDEIGNAMAKARQLVLDLLQDRELQLYQGVRFDGDEAMIGPNDQEELLNIGTYWQEPIGDIEHLRVVATEQGERAYLAMKS